MRKNNFPPMILILPFLCHITISCSNDNDDNISLGEQPELTIVDAQIFVNDYTKADSEGKELLLSTFNKTNKVSANESDVVNQVVTANYSPYELSQTIPMYGPVQKTLPYVFGEYHIMDVDWLVKQHILALWHVKSKEEVTYSPGRIIKAEHKEAVLEGLHLDIIGWQEIRSASNIYVDNSGKNFVSRVEGNLHVVGWGNIPVNEYCIFSVLL